MASFSARYSRAVHVLPLHALKGVWSRQALLGKAQASQQSAVLRSTTREVDNELGFQDVVHFYLMGSGVAWNQVPILEAQIGSNIAPPFPHVALEGETDFLHDDECVLCLWNIAVSRPQIPGVKGGNWTRGTRPSRIASVWRAFKEQTPDCRACSRVLERALVGADTSR